MTLDEFVPPFDLAFLAGGQAVVPVVEDVMRTAVTHITKIGQGFYAHVYQAELAESPHSVIIKCHKYAGRTAKEAQQLTKLKQHALIQIPIVYAVQLATDACPCEMLLMETIPGADAGKVDFPDASTQAQFVEKAIENLLTWHSVHNPEGFGPLGGPFVPRWVDALSQKLTVYHKQIHQEKQKAVVSDYVMRIIDRSFEALPAIFGHINGPASLVHSDYNIWNMMVDPETFQLTGIIDPIDAGWAHYEIDLFHLKNGRSDSGLLERYLNTVDVDEQFWMRFNFYWFWDDIKHYLRMGWYEEGRFRGFAQTLAREMDKWLK